VFSRGSEKEARKREEIAKALSSSPTPVLYTTA